MSPPHARTARGVDLRVSRTQWPPAGHSGDFAEIKRREDGALTVVLADVCGNGDQVAAFAKRARRHVRTALRCFDSPGALFSIVGDVLHGEMPLDAFVAAVGIHIDAAGRTMHAVTAGHLGPFLRRGRTVLSCLSTTSGPPLGIFKSVEYREVVFPLASNDMVICATDGVSDRFATNEDGTGELGLRARIAELPRSRRAGDVHDVDDLCRRLLWSAARPDTDATVLAVAVREFHATTFTTTSVAFYGNRLRAERDVAG